MPPLAQHIAGNMLEDNKIISKTLPTHEPTFSASPINTNKPQNTEESRGSHKNNRGFMAKTLESLLNLPISLDIRKYMGKDFQGLLLPQKSDFIYQNITHRTAWVMMWVIF